MIINFWQNILSPHQSAALRALADLGHHINLIVDQETLPERQRMGWVRPNFGDANLVIAPGPAASTALLEQMTGACNIVSGIRGTRLAAVVLSWCCAHRSPVGLMVEAGDPRGLYGLLRRLRAGADALRWRAHIDFLLTMGQTGVNWYRATGYPAAKVFPFAYVIEAPQGVSPPQRETEQVQLAFAGSLNKLKGVELLLKALSRLTHLRWELAIIGDGPRRRYLQQLVDERTLGDRVRFHGFLPMPRVMTEVAQCDLFVLPSRYDGWGAVVNEALALGVPVICSDHCGAADLLRSTRQGTVFRAGSLPELTHALDERISLGRLSAETRCSIQAMATGVSGSQMAHYLLAILAHVYQQGARPTPPWHDV